MIYRTLWLLAIFAFSHTSIAANINYSSVYEAGSRRIDGALIRYVKTFENNCLEVQRLAAKSPWNVLDRMHLCDFEGKNFSNQYADAGFDEIYFEEDGLHLTLRFTPIEPTGEEKRKCMIAVKDGIMQPLECTPVKH